MSTHHGFGDPALDPHHPHHHPHPITITLITVSSPSLHPPIPPPIHIRTIPAGLRVTGLCCFLGLLLRLFGLLDLVLHRRHLVRNFSLPTKQEKQFELEGKR